MPRDFSAEGGLSWWVLAVRRSCVVWRLLLSVMFLAASFQKLRTPWPAASLLFSRGYVGSMNTGVTIVAVIAVSEALAGIAVLFFPRSRAAIAGGVSMALAVGVFRVILDANSGKMCGCFGAAVVPSALVYFTLIAGSVGLMLEYLAARRGASGRVGRKVLGAAASCGLIIGAGVYVRAPLKDVGGEGVITRVLSIAPDKRTVVVAASSSCADCSRAIHQLAAESGHDERWKDLRLVLAIRETDPGGQEFLRIAAQAELAYLPDRAWWSLVTGSPPVFVFWPDGKTISFTHDMSAVRDSITGAQ